MTGVRKTAAGGRFLLVLVGVLVALDLGACGKPSVRPKGEKDAAAAGPARCGVDEVREYACEALIPVQSSLPAPEPYDTCPNSWEVRDAAFPPKDGTGTFDPRRTEWVRSRVPPGQQCCFSWCGKLQVVDAEAVVDRCRQPLAFAESYCTSELESGTKGDLAASPFDRCALAIRPPEASVFSVPEGAFLDPSLSATRRKGGENLCCYSWCSIAPPGMTIPK